MLFSIPAHRFIIMRKKLSIEKFRRFVVGVQQSQREAG
jgi:hypothetical protein